jgi:outer membrane murein-binding lipoprotein Lpp
MDLQISNISMPVAALLASLIGATATITATLIQLRMAWRREMKARERGQPVTKQARRGPFVAVIVLLIASAVGGFALAQYLNTGKKKEADLLRSEFNAKLDQLNAASERLERIALAAGHGDGTAAANVTLPPCTTCTEQEAAQVELCASVPAAATVGAVELYADAVDETEPQRLQKVEAEQTFAGGRYTGRPQERLESDTRKQVCQGYLHWGTAQARTLRILVPYTPTAP